jgi:PII-like signaling protein
MKLEGEQVLLRIHVSNLVRWHGRPVYEILVDRARKTHLAGATVLNGINGFIGPTPDRGSRHAGLVVEAPMVVEIVDAEDRLNAFLDGVEDILSGNPALVTLERAHVVRYRSRSNRPGGDAL